MRPHDLAQGIQSIVARSPAFPGQRIRVDLIANPRAGGYLRPRFTHKRKRELEQVLEASRALPLRPDPVELRLHLTERSGHAYDIADAIIADSACDTPDDIRLLVTAGGDGTSLETATRLVQIPPSERARFGILRLPLGTGNDGSEGRDLITALGRLLGHACFEPRAAIRVTPRPEGGKPSQWSFNIASIGLDAFVASATNSFKAIFPGDSYKFMVNLATVFYDRIYRVLPMRIDLLSASQHRTLGPAEYLLIALGVSGNRQYGSNKKILPDSRNVCAVSQTSLLRKLLVKGDIERGRHEAVREVTHFDADSLLIEYNERIILQCDGEVTRLVPADFPLRMERIPGLYNILVPAS